MRCLRQILLVGRLQKINEYVKQRIGLKDRIVERIRRSTWFGHVCRIENNPSKQLYIQRYRERYREKKKRKTKQAVN